MRAGLLIAAAFVCAGCANGGTGNDLAGTNGQDARYRTEFPPNTGTAPDFLADCINRVRRDYAVAQDAVRLEDPVEAPDGSRTIDGTADKGAEGVKRFRCIVDAQLRLVDVMALTSDGE